MVVHCLIINAICLSLLEMALLLLPPLVQLLAIVLMIRQRLPKYHQICMGVNTGGRGNLGKVFKWSYANSTHWLHPKCQGIPSTLVVIFPSFLYYAQCTLMYAITYAKATLRSTQVKLASTHIRMCVGFDLGSTRIHQKRVQCGHTQPELNPSWTLVQGAVRTCL